MRMMMSRRKYVSVVDPGTGLSHVVRLNPNIPSVHNTHGDACLLPYNWLFVGIKHVHLLRTPDREDE